MRSECPNPNREGCRWQFREGGCFADTDHIVPQRLGLTALAKTYIDLEMNKQQLCRSVHDEKTAAGDEPLPTIPEMRAAIVEAQASGEIALGRNAMKAVYGRNWKEYQQQARNIRAVISEGESLDNTGSSSGEHAAQLPVDDRSQEQAVYGLRLDVAPSGYDFRPSQS